MVDLSVHNGQLVVELVGLDKLWAFTRRLTIPLAHVVGAHVDPEIRYDGPWLGAGRTDATLGWAVAAGPMAVRARRGGHLHREFWDVHRPENAVVVDLVDEPYTRLVLEVPDPRQASSFLNRVAAAVERPSYG